MNKKKALLTMGLAMSILFVGCGAKNKDTATTDYSSYVTLGDYKGIEVEEEKVEVTDADIESQIKSNLNAKSEKVEIKDRKKVKDGDIVNIDYKGFQGGKAFEGGEDKGFDLTIGSGQFIPGFEDALIGAEVGKKTTIDVTFPEDYSTKELAGKPAQFEVTVNSIKKLVVPELNEEFVKANSDYKTVEEYKESVKADLLKKKQETADQNKLNAIWTKVVENSKVTEYPQEKVDKFVETYKNYYTSMATYYGMELADFLKNLYGMSEEDFNTQSVELAKNSVAQIMICDLIAKKENLTISDEEYKEKAQEYMKQYSYETVEAMEEAVGKEQVVENMLYEKVSEFLTKEAVVK